jgi:hypothetical protein
VSYNDSNMGIDPNSADKFFAHEITVGSGIDGLQERKFEIIDTIFAGEPILQINDSEIAQKAKKRVDLALVHLTKDKKSYNSYEDKFRQAAKVARNIEIYSNLDSIDKSKSLIELGFSIESIDKIMQYARESLGLNYKSASDFDDIGAKPVSSLKEVLEAFVTRNFLRHLFIEEFFPETENMSYLFVHSNGNELSFTNRDSDTALPLMSTEAFKRKVSEFFGLDDFRVIDLFSDDKQSMSFIQLANEIHEIQSIKNDDYSL